MLAAFSLTTLDLVVLGLVAVFALRGAFKGFVWQAVRLVALFGAVWGAGAWHAWVAARLKNLFTFLPDASVPLVSWVLVFLALLILGAYLAHMARGVIRSADLSGLDRTAGFVLGGATGLALCTVLLLLGGAMLVKWNQKQVLEDALCEAQSPEYLVKAAELLAPLLPDGVRADWEDARRCITPD
jgi:membrane protein required for colicin V production